MIAKVIVDVNVKQLNRPFDYIVPIEFESVIERGARVIVPFGARQLMGFVVDFTDSTNLEAKPIIQLLDITPALTPELLTLGVQVAKDTSANLIAVYKLMLPAGLRTEVKSYILQDNKKRYLSEFAPKELQTIKQTQEILFDIKQQANTKYRTKVKRVIKDYVPSSSAQATLLEALSTNDDAIQLKQLAGASAYNTLKKKGVIVEVLQETYRNVDLKPETKDITLTIDQTTALANLKPGGNVLFGVTGSGKTEVYLSAIEQALANHKTALFLVPEISLTYQTVARLVGRFGEQVAILHSGLSIGERYDEWRKFTLKTRVVVGGARSAPSLHHADNVSVVSLMEEHGHSYKQEGTSIMQRRCTHKRFSLTIQLLFIFRPRVQRKC